MIQKMKFIKKKFHKMKNFFFSFYLNMIDLKKKTKKTKVKLKPAGH